MKQFLFLLALTAIIGCSKENVSNSVIGSWIISERIQDTGGQTNTESFSLRDIMLQFNADGTLSVTGSTSASASCPLTAYDRYEAGSDYIRFFHSASPETITVHYSLSQQLVFEYPTRCYFSERFVRTR